MKQEIFHRSIFLCLLIYLSTFCIESYAYHVATINIRQGVQTKVSLPSEWINELSLATIVPQTLPWSSSDPSLVIRSNSRYYCYIITYNLTGQFTLTYDMDFTDRNGKYKQLNLTWIIKIDNSTPDPGPDPAYEEDQIQEPTDDWGKNGNYTISWYNKNLSEFAISTNKELAGMAYLINNGYTNFKDCTIKLANNIDLSDKKWISCKTFQGTFDGQGHSIIGVFVGSDEEDQLNFGFWRNLSGATIENLYLEGIGKFHVKQKTNSDATAGGVAGVARNSLIRNCRVNMDVYFKRGEVQSWYTLQGNDNVQSWSYVGGIVGRLTSKGIIENCVNLGSLRYYSREKNMASQGLCLGGIAGSCEKTTTETIEFCENLSPLMKVVDSNTKGQGHAFYKYINGISHKGGRNKCCRSVIDEVNVDVQSHGGRSWVYVCGISADGNNTNCYSIISNIRLYTTSTTTNLFYGGISSYKEYSSSPQACFSNNDPHIDMDYTREIEKGRDGSIDFSSAQMKTSAFLDELNIYSMMEMDGPIWKKKEGEYPYINEPHNIDTRINNNFVNPNNDRKNIYDLFGRKINKLQKGINIINGKKTVVK